MPAADGRRRPNAQNEPNFPSAAGGCWRQNAQNEPNFARSWASAGGQMRKTNPISRRRRPRTKEIAQNEPKLGGTGVYRQRGLSCGAWLGRGARDCGVRIADCELKEAGRRPNVQNEPNLVAGGLRLRIGDCGVRIEGVGRGRPTCKEPNCAKRTQFRPAVDGRRRPNVQNEPNLVAGGPRLRIGDCELEDAGREQQARASVQNEANSA
jgi:hypothetical protein